MKKIVAISGGKDSTAMALRLAEAEPDDYTFVITVTGRELPPVNAHWNRLENLLHQPIWRIKAPTLVELIIQQKALPNHQMRWCTRLIKLEPFYTYTMQNSPATTFVGIRADEARAGGVFEETLMIKQDFPLVRWGWGISEVTAYLKLNKVEIPKRTDCDCCFFQRLIEWYELWRDYPERWSEAEALEDFTGHTFRSPARDTWPAKLSELAACFAAGRIPKDTRDTARSSMCSWCAR